MPSTHSSPQASSSVDNLDVQLGSPLQNSDSLLGADAVSNLGGKDTVVHQEQFKLSGVLDQELLESVGEEVTGLAVGTVSDLGHGNLALETSADTVINTLGLSPCVLFAKYEYGPHMKSAKSLT